MRRGKPSPFGREPSARAEREARSDKPQGWGPRGIEGGWLSVAKPGEGLLLLLLLVTLAAGCQDAPAPVVPEGPVEWSVNATVDKNEVQVGEDLTLTITVTHPVGGDFVPPPAADFEPFDVIEQGNEEVSPVESRIHYRLAAYRLPEA